MKRYSRFTEISPGPIKYGVHGPFVPLLYITILFVTLLGCHTLASQEDKTLTRYSWFCSFENKQKFEKSNICHLSVVSAVM